jgi:peptidyl-prolyl cis-trans isomerase A (cyclophilin A)
MQLRSLLSTLILGAGAAIAQPTASPAEPPASTPQPEKHAVTVRIETSLGAMTAELDADKAPATVSNFLAYVDQTFYDSTIFHRVMPGFMIQGGGFTQQMRQKSTRPPIRNEAANGLKNDRGTLAMARTGDPDSATSQFFINHRDNRSLNRPSPDGFGYAVFGRLTDGLDVLDKIAAVPTGSAGGHRDVPLQPVVILSIRRHDAAAPAP